MLHKRVMPGVLFATELERRGTHLDGFLTNEYHDVPAFTKKSEVVAQSAEMKEMAAEMNSRPEL